MTLPAPLRARTFSHEALLGLLLVVLLSVAWRTAPGFVGPTAQLELASHIWELALLTLPLTLIIISGGIDLSVGATMALSAVSFGLAFEAGLPVVCAAALALLVGALAGVLNGVFVAYVRVHPLIVTLATLSAYRGIAEGISLGRPITGFPASFAMLGRGSVLGVPVPGLLFAFAALAAGIVLARTTLGRALYAMGHNETTCRFSGLRVARIKLALYTLSGLASALAALLFVARRNTAKADVGAGLELDAITAVVLGGTSIFGGRGRILGTLLGTLVIHETREFVSWRWNNDELILVVVGLVLILSVLPDGLSAARRRSST
jgi:rhamnose transport system permease protein